MSEKDWTVMHEKTLQILNIHCQSSLPNCLLQRMSLITSCFFYAVSYYIFFKSEYLQIIFFPSHNLSSFPLCQFDSPNFYFEQSFLFVYFFIDFDGYYIVRTDEGQPSPKYIFNKCGTNIYFFTLQRFGPSPSLKFKIN